LDALTAQRLQHGRYHGVAIVLSQGVTRDTAAPPSHCYLSSAQGKRVMITRNGYLVQQQIYPLVQLSAGIALTFGCIGLLAYGMLALMGY
jgi:hypothetical protein